MNVLAKAEESPKFININQRRASLVLAALFVLMATSQLFKYESFPGVLSGYWLLGDEASVRLLAAILVITEVFALPFLLRMRAGPLMRLTSLACAWIAATIWLVLSIWAVTATNALSNSGLLGATVRTPAGVLELIFALVLVGLVAYITWSERATFSLRPHKR